MFGFRKGCITCVCGTVLQTKGCCVCWCLGDGYSTLDLVVCIHDRSRARILLQQDASLLHCCKNCSATFSLVATAWWAVNSAGVWDASWGRQLLSVACGITWLVQIQVHEVSSLLGVMDCWDSCRFTPAHVHKVCCANQTRFRRLSKHDLCVFT